jgi:3-dehydroquinate synthase
MFSSLVKTSEHVLITDSNVAELYLVQLIECLEGLHIRAHPIIVTAGEQTKTLQTYTNLAGHCAGFGLDKESTVMSFGGGVVKDLAGFLASTFLRGLNLVHIPTTMLAQVDAAIDWKQAINLPQGKNLIGSMYSPSEIWVNAAFLRTLDERWIRDGLGESVKVALCRSLAFLDLLAQAALSDSGWTSRVVDASVSLKIENLNRESQSEEAVKQYGHAIGHAVEHLSSGSLGHGESIAIGMCVSAELASLAGLTDTITVQKHYDVFEKLELPTRLPEDQHPSRVWAQIRFDKHFLRGEMYAPVLKCVGTLVENEEGQFMIPFSQDIVLQALDQNKTRSVATM